MISITFPCAVTVGTSYKLINYNEYILKLIEMIKSVPKYIIVFIVLYSNI